MIESWISEPLWYSSSWMALTATIACLYVATALWFYKKGGGKLNDLLDKDDADTPRPPPMARGGLPFLGHALDYQTDPVGFLLKQEAWLGPLFRVNLAGRCMTIVGGTCAELQHQVSKMPESVMSSKQAVAEIGFEETLGKLNVYHGTDIHKRILKDYYNVSKNNNNGGKVVVMSQLYQCIRDSIQTELAVLLSKEDSNSETEEGSGMMIPDLFYFVRRCIVRTILDSLISPHVLMGGCVMDANELLNDFLSFQNDIEDATAKAAVLPRWLAIPLVLRRVVRTRRNLEQRLASYLQQAASQSTTTTHHGPWMQYFISNNQNTTRNYWNDAASLVLGLLFAAHKNASIGACQTFLFLMTQATPEQLSRAQMEAKKLDQAFSHPRPQDNDDIASDNPLHQATLLRQAVLETMRLTAHSIGAIRKAQQDLILTTATNNGSQQEYIIHEGDTIAMSHITTHLNPSIWGNDAKKFDLQRMEEFVDNVVAANNSSSSPVRSKYNKLITFSQGTHKCPGEQMAMTLMQFVVALLFQHETTIVQTPLPPISFERATLAQRNGPVPVIMKHKTMMEE